MLCALKTFLLGWCTSSWFHVAVRRRILECGGADDEPAHYFDCLVAAIVRERVFHYALDHKAIAWILRCMGEDGEAGFRAASVCNLLLGAYDAKRHAQYGPGVSSLRAAEGVPETPI